MIVRSFFVLFLIASSLLTNLPTLGAADKDKAPAEAKKYGGFGGAATGGAGHPTVEVKNLQELTAALQKGNATIVVKAHEIHIPTRIDIRSSNITLDGQGATLRGDKLSRTNQMLKFFGKNIIVKNLRLRNAGDNVAFYGKLCQDCVVDHVSSTGSGDDGVSVSNGASSVTITHCFLAGCTRSIFIKYDKTTRVTIDHSILMKHWIRAPLIVDCNEFDVRNNIIQHWTARGFGTGIEGKGSNGNVMGNIYRVGANSPRPDASIILFGQGWGKVYVNENAFKDAAKNRIKGTGTTDKPIPTPAIIPAYTTNLDELEKMLMSDTEGAGCMPRDVVDKLYFAAKKWAPDHDNAFRIPETGKPLPTK